MFTHRRQRVPVLAVLATLLFSAGCERDESTLAPATYPVEAEIFIDEFGPAVSFQAFLGSKLDALDVTTTETYRGNRALQFIIPNEGDAAGGFAGGAFVSESGRDLSGFNALTFWAKSSMPATINEAGFGNDNTGSSRYVAWKSGLSVSTTWRKYVLPIPDPAKLTGEKGLFFLAEGPEGGDGYVLYIDDVQFELLGTIAHPRPSIASRTLVAEIGDSFTVGGLEVSFDISGERGSINAMPGYFTFTSSDPAVATVDADGVITAVGLGQARITALVGAQEADGVVSISVGEPAEGPSAPAPTPSQPAASVISLFSDAYTDVSVDTWSADWDDAQVEDVQIAGDNVKKYSQLAFAGIEFTSRLVDASEMTHFHMDVWTPDPTDAAESFLIKLVDFGPDGVFGGGDDAEHELAFSASSAPALTPNAWVGIDVPLSAFAGLRTRGHLAQLVISGSVTTVFIDNIYFYSGAAATSPTTPAPAPTLPATDVISLFSNAYSNVSIDTWSAEWDDAEVEGIRIAGDDIKKYSNLVFAGIEFTSSTLDASGMTHFHIDVWTPDPVEAPGGLRIKLVDFGADGKYQGGDDVEHELTFNRSSTPALRSGSWIGLDIPLSAFSGLTTRAHLAQLIISGEPNSVFIDNVYFHK
ncbi:MAG: Ig-like domain-containing protein [Bacteroidota bacterium]|nr:Ig-like domain-containing protein [Bacteroidota bacterium]